MISSSSIHLYCRQLSSISTIMEHRISCRSALSFTKLTVYLSRTWPLSRVATKRETTMYDIAWCISFLNALCLLFPLVFSMVKYPSNSFIVTQSACFAGGVCNLLFKMILYRVHMKRTQTLILEMDDFLEKAQPHEEIILQRYVHRCSSFHGFISILNYLAAAMVVTVPLFDPNQSFPTSAVYPFSIDSGIAMYLAYIHQTIVGFQCVSGLTVDCQAAVMLWFAGARIEMLAEELKYVSNAREFDLFVRKHRKLLSYADDVSDMMSYVAFASSTTCGIAAIMSSLQLFGNQSFAVKIQFGPVALMTTLNLFICAWPAENLINVCDLLANSVFNTKWFDMPLTMMKNFHFLLGRCQRAVIVSVAGFLPTLSLHSYSTFVSAIYSYVTTLRLVMTTNNEK